MAQTSQPSAVVLAIIAEAGHGILQTKFAYMAAYSVVLYDHLLTLDVEIEHIWKRKFSAVSGLFFLTRYYFLFSLTLVLFVFIVPVVDTKICERMLLFVPLGAGTPSSILADCIISLRVYALYERNNKLAWALFLYILAEFSVSMWTNLTPTVTRIDVFGALGFPEVGNAPAMQFCVPQLSAKLTGLETSLGQILQSIFDTVVVALILIKTRKRDGSGIVALIVKQGLAYYMLNTALYLTWTFMLIFAPDASKNVMGGPSLGLVCVSVNRLTLHLRSYNTKPESGYTDAIMRPSTTKLRRRSSWLGASTLQVMDMSSDGGFSTLEMHDMFGDGDRKNHSLNSNSSFLK